MAFVVENPAYDEDGAHRATFRIYVATEERAKELSQTPGATYREIAPEEMPAKARENLRGA